MKNKRRKDIGRMAINFLREEYEQGGEYAGTAQIREALLRDCALPVKHFSAQQIASWERQARYEAWKNKTAVTAPVRTTNYLRSASASPAVRQLSYYERHRHVLTVVSNHLLNGEATAAAPDATMQEIRAAAYIEIAKNALENAEAIMAPVAVGPERITEGV